MKTVNKNIRQVRDMVIEASGGDVEKLQDILDQAQEELSEIPLRAAEMMYVINVAKDLLGEIKIKTKKKTKKK